MPSSNVDTMSEAIRKGVPGRVREKFGFDEKDLFFNMQTFRASKNLSEKHDDI